MVRTAERQEFRMAPEPVRRSGPQLTVIAKPRPAGALQPSIDGCEASRLCERVKTVSPRLTSDRVGPDVFRPGFQLAGQRPHPVQLRPCRAIQNDLLVVSPSVR